MTTVSILTAFFSMLPFDSLKNMPREVGGDGGATGNMGENWLDSNFSFLKRPITNRNLPQNSILFQWLQKREHWCGISYEINSAMTEVSII